jgi:hypothetical protein
MAASTIALTNPFFSSIGLLQRLAVGTYMPSEAVIAFFRASAKDPDTAARKLAPTFKNTWFCQALMPRLTYAPMQEHEVLKALEKACAANEDNKKAVAFLLEFLVLVGIVERDGDLVRIVAPHVAGAATLSLHGTVADAWYSLTLQIDSNWNSEQIGTLFQELADRFIKKLPLAR